MNDIKYGRKVRGIRRELQKKIKDWLESIEDEQVRKVAEKDVIITGGAIASMLLGEKINDYDVYFRTEETTEKVAEYYVAKFNESNTLKTAEGVVAAVPEVRCETITNIKGENENRVCIFIKSAGVASEDQEGTYDYFESRPEDEMVEYVEGMIQGLANDPEKKKYRPIFLSQNAITLSHNFQIVIRFYGEPDEIHSNYDFVHATCYFDYKKNVLETPAEALLSLLSRTLYYLGSLYPIASIFRMKKFIERGWRISAGQQLKIMWQISEIDLTDEETMREQLTGVDAAYMWQLIQALKDVESDKINSVYVAEIIDRIFDN